MSLEQLIGYRIDQSGPGYGSREEIVAQIPADEPVFGYGPSSPSVPSVGPWADLPTYSQIAVSCRTVFPAWRVLLTHLNPVRHLLDPRPTILRAVAVEVRPVAIGSVRKHERTLWEITHRIPAEFSTRLLQAR